MGLSQIELFEAISGENIFLEMFAENAYRDSTSLFVKIGKPFRIPEGIRIGFEFGRSAEFLPGSLAKFLQSGCDYWRRMGGWQFSNFHFIDEPKQGTGHLDRRLFFNPRKQTIRL